MTHQSIWIWCLRQNIHGFLCQPWLDFEGSDCWQQVCSCKYNNIINNNYSSDDDNDNNISNNNPLPVPTKHSNIRQSAVNSQNIFQTLNKEKNRFK